MNSYKELEEQLEAELKILGFEIRPYGGKKITGENSKILVIAPDKHTGMTRHTDLLDEHGLRGHPGIKWTRITHLGYLDGSEDPEESLAYRFLDPEGRVIEKYWKRGDSFYSVGPECLVNGLPVGYWNTLMNRSEKPIKVKVREEFKPKE